MRGAPNAARGTTLAIFVALFAVAGCRDDSDRTTMRAADLRDVDRMGSVGDSALTESSGLTPSTDDAALYWSHNDSGNQPLLFALDTTGAPRGRFRVTGASNLDWEAMAAGPCEGGACLYIADVGDNRARRRTVTVWRVREPLLPPDDSLQRPGRDVTTEAATEPAMALTFRYPDEPHDVEAMWVSPDTSVWLVTKRPLRGMLGALRPVLVFRLQASAWRATAPVVAELVDSLPIVPVPGNSSSWVTDAAFTARGPDGPSVAVRTYQDLTIFDADSITGRPGKPRARCRTAALHERFGEAVAWMPDGRLFFTSEGEGSRLWTARC